MQVIDSLKAWVNSFSIALDPEAESYTAVSYQKFASSVKHIAGDRQVSCEQKSSVVGAPAAAVRREQEW
jgi:hypothetical protein